MVRVSSLILSAVIIRAQGFLNFNLSNSHPAFDPKFYESVLDPEKCQKQLNYMVDRILPTVLFADASAKIPKGIFDGNLFDLGNYHQCLSIDYNEDEMDIKGKYCIILIDTLDIVRLWLHKSIPNKDDLTLFKYQSLVNAYVIEKVTQQLISWQKKGKKLNTNSSEADYPNKLSKENISEILELLPSEVGILVSLGVCVPKVCTPQQAINSSLFDIGIGNYDLKTLRFKEAFCRLPNDKPWSPADTVAVIIFSSIGTLTLISTVYDVVYRFILKRDVKHSYLKIFSAYTNGSRLVEFTSNSDTLRCLDGIRVVSTLWVIYGHTTIDQVKYFNAIGYLMWEQSIRSVHITATPLSVDTFFTMSGMLLVYTSTKIGNGKKFIKNIHVFYLNRLLRLFPILATAVLLQASLFHRMSDGPMWTNVERSTDICRSSWWITLLYLQNFVFSETCLLHSWYLAIDVHLYLLSPLVVYWVLSNGKSAWIALTTTLLVALLSATMFNFKYNFMVNVSLNLDGVQNLEEFWNLYYVNVLTRASPFIVGMIFGYLLHIYRDKEVRLGWLSVLLLWSATFFVLISDILVMHFTIQENWDHQIIDNLLNSFMRPVWAAAIGWLVFACRHGYGGPLNWILSLDMWCVPARLCYGAYLFHGPMIHVIGDSMTTLDHFSSRKLVSVILQTFMFLVYTTVAFFLSYLATVLIDGPFMTIVKRMFEKKKNKESTKL